MDSLLRAESVPFLNKGIKTKALMGSRSPKKIKIRQKIAWDGQLLA
jgi:hypothetical protein